VLPRESLAETLCATPTGFVTATSVISASAGVRFNDTVLDASWVSTVTATLANLTSAVAALQAQAGATAQASNISNVLQTLQSLQANTNLLNSLVVSPPPPPPSPSPPPSPPPPSPPPPSPPPPSPPPLSPPPPRPPVSVTWTASATGVNCMAYTTITVPGFCGATTTLAACEAVCAATSGCTAIKWAYWMNAVASSCPGGGAGYSWCMLLSSYSNCVYTGDIWQMFYLSAPPPPSSPPPPTMPSPPPPSPSLRSPPPPPAPLTFAQFVTYEGWAWTGGGGSSLSQDVVTGNGAYSYNTSSGGWGPITLWQPSAGTTCTGPGSCNANAIGTNAPTNMSAGVGPSCCSWSGNCGGSNQNCQFCTIYVRSAPFYFSAGTYTISGTVDDSVTWRLLPQSGASYVQIGGFGSFTVPTSGNYVLAATISNREYCASLKITSLAPMNSIYGEARSP
jgi:hypothetical protein